MTRNKEDLAELHVVVIGQIGGRVAVYHGDLRMIGEKIVVEEVVAPGYLVRLGCRGNRLAPIQGD